ncbi:M81 family metallopeptidase [Mesorhizobium sp. M0913]|uniref:M81 family metallopeptidase n=1 Tax=Mesorhizobium sp. M0913 TaxID=2957026 RepID=UPI00333CF5CB
MNAGRRGGQTARSRPSPPNPSPHCHRQGLDHGRTQVGPMRELIDRGKALEASGMALVVSVCAGFDLSDIYDFGPTVNVTADGDTGLKGGPLVPLTGLRQSQGNYAVRVSQFLRFRCETTAEQIYYGFPMKPAKVGT